LNNLAASKCFLLKDSFTKFLGPLGATKLLAEGVAFSLYKNDRNALKI